MFGNNAQREAGRSIFVGSTKGLANTLAVGATFFGTPPLHAATVPWVEAFAEHHYGYAWADAANLGWFVICALIVFFLSRMTLATSLVLAGLAVAARFI